MFESDERVSGSVYLAGEPGWRGLIYKGNHCLFRGAERSLRSLALADIERANREGDFKAKIHEPLPDEVPPWVGYSGQWPVPVDERGIE